MIGTVQHTAYKRDMQLPKAYMIKQSNWKMKNLILILHIFLCLQAVCRSRGDAHQMAACGRYRRPTRYEEVCCTKENLGRTFTQVREDGSLSYLLCPRVRPSSCPVFTSCDDYLKYYPTAGSGYYKIIIAGDKSIKVYCSMEESRCAGEKGWIRVAHVDMKEPNATCPTGLTEKQYSDMTHGLCVNNYTGVEPMSCDAAVFPTNGISYSKVCGRVHGYQHGRGLAFSPVDTYNFGNANISSVYLTGVSITHGTKHIWSFASGWSEEIDDEFGSFTCPCTGSAGPSPPSEVGKHFYCESGREQNSDSNERLYTNDKLWDGLQCNNEENECCTEDAMPWFHRSLPSNSTEDITLRVCGRKPECKSGNKCEYWDTPIELIELYIK